MTFCDKLINKSDTHMCSERNEDGKSFKNPQHGILSKAYEEFPDPISKDRRGGFDIHIYHYQVPITIQLVRNLKLLTKSIPDKPRSSGICEGPLGTNPT